MSTERFLASSLVGWPIAVLAALAGRTFIGPDLSPPEWAAWVWCAWMPVVATVLMRRGGLTASIAPVRRHTTDTGPGRKTTETVPRV